MNFRMNEIGKKASISISLQELKCIWVYMGFLVALNSIMESDNIGVNSALLLLLFSFFFNAEFLNTFNWQCFFSLSRNFTGCFGTLNAFFYVHVKNLAFNDGAYRTSNDIYVLAHNARKLFHKRSPSNIRHRLNYILSHCAILSCALFECIFYAMDATMFVYVTWKAIACFITSAQNTISDQLISRPNWIGLDGTSRLQHTFYFF